MELVDQLETLVPEAGPRPIDLLKLKGKERQRAPRKKTQSDDRTWKWGEES
jgi:hypothetical protein